MHICAPSGHFWNLYSIFGRLFFIKAECEISCWDFLFWRLFPFQIISTPSIGSGLKIIGLKKPLVLVSKKVSVSVSMKTVVLWLSAWKLPPPTEIKSMSLTLSASLFFFCGGKFSRPYCIFWYCQSVPTAISSNRRLKTKTLETISMRVPIWIQDRPCGKIPNKGFCT